MDLRRVAVLLAIVGVASGAMLRGALTVSKRGLEHDEGISYLCAAGNLGQYDGVYRGGFPAGRWVTAGEWKRLWQVRDFPAFRRIAQDQAKTDIHPPGYFWLLHAWCALCGTYLWSGPALNVLLSLLSAGLLYGVIRRVSGMDWAAGVAVFVWMHSPAAVATSGIARQYELMGLAGLMFVRALCAFGVERSGGPGDAGCVGCAEAGGSGLRIGAYGALAGTVAFGMLIHYYFALWVAAGWLWLAWVHGWNVRTLRVTLALGVGGAILMCLHPGFYRSFLSGSVRPDDLAWPAFLARVELVGYTLASFFWGWQTVRWWHLGVIVGLCGLLAGGRVGTGWRGLWLRGARGAGAVSAGAGGVGCGRVAAGQDRGVLSSCLLCVCVCVVVAQVALYLGFITPMSAMGPRYLGMVWPLVGGLLAIGVCRRERGRVVRGALLCGLFLVLGWSDGWRVMTERAMESDGRPVLRAADMVVVDNVARGVLPRIIWDVPDDKPVYAVNRSALLAGLGDWTNRFSSCSVLVTEELYTDAPGRRGEVVGAASGDGARMASLAGVWGTCELFVRAGFDLDGKAR